MYNKIGHKFKSRPIFLYCVSWKNLDASKQIYYTIGCLKDK